MQSYVAAVPWKDPASVQVRNVRLQGCGSHWRGLINGGGYLVGREIDFEVNAKNSYGGYTGFEHNLYRIEIAELKPAQPPMFKWSQFNGGLVGTGFFDATPTPPTLTVIGNKSAIATSGLTDCYVEAFELDAQLGYWKLTYAAPATLGDDDTISLKTASFGAIPGGTTPRFFRLWNGLRLISDFPSTAW